MTEILDPEGERRPPPNGLTVLARAEFAIRAGAPNSDLLKALIAEIEAAADAVIEHIVSHWFTQGGQAQFGELDLPSVNADGIVSAILTAVRKRLDFEAAALPRSPAPTGKEKSE